MKASAYDEKRELFYEVNSDFAGHRDITNENNEQIDFHNRSSVRIWYNDLAENYQSHWHGAIEIIMPIENNYYVTVGNTDYIVKPNEIMIIPPRELHSLTAPSTGKRFIFMLDITSITQLKGFSGIQALLMQPLYITAKTYPYIFDEVYQLLVQMRNEYFTKNTYAELTIISLMLTVFTTFGQNHINAKEVFPNVRLYKKKEYVQKFNDLMDYIDHHYTEDLHLEDLANTIGFSKYHFARLFKEYTNYTFGDYVCFRRVKAAEELLIEPNLSITEIALQAGFPSISTFNRIFKLRKHCTPSEYRLKNNHATSMSL